VIILVLSGKQLRLSRILENGKTVIIPMDHGVTVGPVKGLVDIEDTINKVVAGGATAVLFHKGILRSLDKAPSCGVIVHLSASTNLGPEPNFKIQVGTVEEALKLGVDAVSIHVNVGNDMEHEMLEILGEVAGECEEFQVPLLAMLYPRGHDIEDPHDPNITAHAARIGAELGADIVKTHYTGSPESFREVIKGCPVPLVMAGGPKTKTDRECLEMIKGAMDAGAIGVAMGRNAFQHENPTAIVKAVRAIVVDGVTVEEALEFLK
jgi:fructose-bisphosphate aldolase/2-amino-3,7-dideoxy-D-threo-hept-6-ulosonate synthase